MEINSKSRIKTILLDYAVIAAMAVLIAANYYFFIVRNGFAPAGTNGIATMVEYKTGFSLGYFTFILIVPFCIFAFFFVSKKVAVRTLWFSAIYSAVYLILQNSGLDHLQYDAHGSDTVFPAMLSGIISGLVFGVCFKRYACTGGMDVISRYVHKKNPVFNYFWVAFTLNSIIAAVSLFVYAKPDETGAMVYDYKPVCLCILYCFVSNFVGNYIIRGTKQAIKFTVITPHAEDITKEMMETLHHGVTQISAVGSYTNDERRVLFCVINKHQIEDFKKILNKYEGTFAFSETVNSTYGYFLKVK